MDAANRLHTTDECPQFSGQWRLMSLADALAAGCAPCPDCGADAYAEAIYPAPTPTPEPETVHPSTALKPAGELKVYYYNSGKYYHVGPNCSHMSGAPAHTLAEALADGKRACGTCKPAPADVIDQPVLWQDKNGLCHTGDDCAAFSGRATLIGRDEALAKGLEGCPDCGGDEYLVPDTVIGN
ncbi:MAG: hypothetical protein IKN05_01375 [Clostridia bacterium]|nr:hypothetical protein [Clostridia bacterium]